MAYHHQELPELIMAIGYKLQGWCMDGTNHPLTIVAVSNYWYYNLRGFKTGIVESNKVSNYYVFY